MSVHIEAKKGDIAERVLFPGDPLRAEYIAKTFLKDVTRYNTRRNMFGFTGFTPSWYRVSVQGSGMGMPSLGIYAYELITEYGVKEIIRVGTCGGMQEDIGLGDIILAQGASSDSNLNRRRFNGLDFAPLADWRLLSNASSAARRLGLSVRVGGILASDSFYPVHGKMEYPAEWKLWASYGVLAVEMESAELYTIAAREGVRALSILTVSDILQTRQHMSPEDRERTLVDMVRIAIDL